MRTGIWHYAARRPVGLTVISTFATSSSASRISPSSSIFASAAVFVEASLKASLLAIPIILVRIRIKVADQAAIVSSRETSEPSPDWRNGWSEGPNLCG